MQILRTGMLGRRALGSCTLAACLALTAHVGLSAQETEDPVVRFGSGDLTPPEGAADQDAKGTVSLLEKGERNAVHVRVGNLEPGATYEVKVTKGDATATAGNITTHDGTPPPARCFSAKLRVPAAPEPAGAGGGFDRHRDGGGMMDDDGGMMGDRVRGAPHGHALFHLNEEGTELKYWVVAVGLTDVASIKLAIGDTSGDLETDGTGTFAVTAEQVALINEGKATVTVASGGDPVVTLTGTLAPCFSEIREHLAGRKAGRGTLRIDTGRGDTLPLGALTVADLVGAIFTVVDGQGTVVLSGSVAELLERGKPHDGGDGHGGDPPGADEPCEADLSRPDPAVDDNAVGEVEIEGEELEVEVGRLASRSTYDVVLVEPTEGGTSATLGQIKTGWGGGANVEFKAAEGVTLPFGKTKISELLGYGVEIKNADGQVVLKGAIPTTACAAEKEDGGSEEPAGGGGAFAAAGPDAYFQVDERHDARFTRGDANEDATVNLADAVTVLFHLFQGGPAPYCADAIDADDNGQVSISDPILILQYLYQGGATIAAPFPEAGFDATPDGLLCEPISG